MAVETSEVSHFIFFSLYKRKKWLESVKKSKNYISIWEPFKLPISAPSFGVGRMLGPVKLL